MPPSSMDSSTQTHQPAVGRALCLLVVAIIVIAVMYAAWIGIGNFSRIGV